MLRYAVCFPVQYFTSLLTCCLIWLEIAYLTQCGFGICKLLEHTARRFSFHIRRDHRQFKTSSLRLKPKLLLGSWMLRCFITVFRKVSVTNRPVFSWFYGKSHQLCAFLSSRTSDLWELLISPSVTCGTKEHGPAEWDRPLSHPFPYMRGCWRERRLLGAHLCGWTLHPSLLLPLPHHPRHQRFAGWLTKKGNVNVQE